MNLLRVAVSNSASGLMPVSTAEPQAEKAGTDASPSFSRPRRLAGLTGLRAIAALSVVVHHFGIGLMPAWTQGYFRNGGYLVDVFFVLSGFLLGYAYTDSRGLTTRPQKFLCGRLARLYPAYLVGLLLALPRFHELLPHGSRLAAGIKIALVSFFTVSMTQAWVPKTQSWNDPGWSLSDEAFFYLAMTLLAPIILRYRLVTRVAAMTVFCAVTALLINIFQYGDWVSRIPLLRIGPFLFAMIIGNLFGTGFLPSIRAGWATLLQCASCVVLAVVVAHPAPLGWDHLLASAVALIVIMLLAAEPEGGVSRFLDTPPLRLLGDASYGIYIYQVGIFWLGIHLLRRTHLGPGVIFFTELAALVVFAVVSVRFYETPARRAIMRVCRPLYDKVS